MIERHRLTLTQHIPAIQALCAELGVTRLELCDSDALSEATEKPLSCFIVTIPTDGDPVSWACKLVDLEERLGSILGREVDFLLPGALRNDWVRQHLARRRIEVYDGGKDASWT
jgi:predicted nucleotidyltransferase